MPSLQPKILYIGANTASNVYTVANVANNYSIIRTFHVCNANTGSSKTVSIHILSPAATAGPTNVFISNVSIPANDIISIDSTIALQAGFSIHVVHSGNITTTISGVEYS